MSLTRKFFQKVVNEGFTIATKLTIKYIFNQIRNTIRNITSHAPGEFLYWYFETMTKSPNRSDANPMNPIWVNPDEIIYYHSGYPGRRFGIVVGGEWDKPDRPFEQNIVYRSIKNRYVNELPWSETAIYKVYTKLPEDATVYGRNFQDEEELYHYLNRIDKLYESISKNGYKTQKELLEDGTQPKDPTSDSPHILLNEVSVHIYRDGSLAKYGAGNHRLSIAKVNPNVEKIPVLVRARHTEWQQIRDEIRTTDSYDNLDSKAKQHLDHPDLVDIVPEKWID